MLCALDARRTCEPGHGRQRLLLGIPLHLGLSTLLSAHFMSRSRHPERVLLGGLIVLLMAYAFAWAESHVVMVVGGWETALKAEVHARFRMITVVVFGLFLLVRRRSLCRRVLRRENEPSA